MAWRIGKIGASDLGAIMGVSPFTSRFEMMQIKLGMRKTRDNPAMAHGRANEDAVLRMVKIRLNDPELVTLTAESITHPWMVAQFDGISSRHCVEIKCPTSPKLLREISESGIPKHYLYQLQAQMFVSGFEKSIFCVWFEQTLRIFEVPADKALQTDLVSAAKQFVEDLDKARQGSLRR